LGVPRQETLGEIESFLGLGELPAHVVELGLKIRELVGHGAVDTLPFESPGEGIATGTSKYLHESERGWR
jgi:hypothetical protein